MWRLFNIQESGYSSPLTSLNLYIFSMFFVCLSFFHPFIALILVEINKRKWKRKRKSEFTFYIQKHKFPSIFPIGFSLLFPVLWWCFIVFFSFCFVYIVFYLHLLHLSFLYPSLSERIFRFSIFFFFGVVLCLLFVHILP